MGIWRDFLRLLGLSGDARVHISAPGIDVVITGEPEQVRALLGVVKYELERSARWRDRHAHPLPAGASKDADAPPPASPPSARRPPGSQVRSSQYVQPTELDEMDSPYALPDPLVMPVEDTTGERERPGSTDRTTGEQKSENGSRPADSQAKRAASEASEAGGPALPVRNRLDPPRAYTTEPATLVPDVYETRDDPQGPTGPQVKAIRPTDARPMLGRNESPPQEVKNTKIDSRPPPSESDEGEREVTAVQPNPSGPVASPPSASTQHPAPSTPSASGSLNAPAILRSSSPFVTDGGPTLTPSVSDSGVQQNLRSSDPDSDETKETSRRES